MFDGIDSTGENQDFSSPTGHRKLNLFKWPSGAPKDGNPVKAAHAGTEWLMVPLPKGMTKGTFVCPEPAYAYAHDLNGELQDSAGTRVEWIKPDGKDREGVSLEDFHAYMPMHSYIYTPSREMWPATSVNGRIPPVPLLDEKGKPAIDKAGNPIKIPASSWLDKNKPVEQMTWAPGKPMLIKNRLISDGGWIDRYGVSCFNLYRPPAESHGDPALAGVWIDHVNRVYPNDANHIMNLLAQRVQCPAEKVNHALVLGGKQGIGKDTLLEPVKAAVGPWNFAEVKPQQILGRFNSFLKSVILRVSEARDLGDVNRFSFYDHMKDYTAAPPDVLRVDEKHLREHAILNCTGVISRQTTNQTIFICLPMAAATMSPGAISQKMTSPTAIGANCGIGTPAKATAM